MSIARKVLFIVLLGWWLLPLMFIGRCLGDLFNYGESPAERKWRRANEP